jgi:hypothetical protein
LEKKKLNFDFYKSHDEFYRHNRNDVTSPEAGGEFAMKKFRETTDTKFGEAGSQSKTHVFMKGDKSPNRSQIEAGLKNSFYNQKFIRGYIKAQTQKTKTNKESHGQFRINGRLVGGEAGEKPSLPSGFAIRSRESFVEVSFYFSKSLGQT